MTASTHDDPSCGGLVIEVDGLLQCAGCGVGIRGTAKCPECGASVNSGTTQNIVSLRPQVAEPALEAALAQRIQSDNPNPLERDQLLSAVAGAYARRRVECAHYATRTDIGSLSAHVEAQASTIGGYQTHSLETHPNGQTAEAIATELYGEFLTGFPNSDTEFSHLGVGVRWDPRGSITAGVVAAKRLVDLPDDINPTQIETAVHSATNRQRRKHGYEPFQYNKQLAGVALSHSREMASGGYFAHRAPDGTTTMDRHQEAGYESTRAAENISKQYPVHGTSAEDIAEAILTSSHD